MTRGVSILGATGSIGAATLAVMAQYPERFYVVALTAHKNLKLLVEQCRIWKPQYAVISDPLLLPELTECLSALSLETRALAGSEAIIKVASLAQVDIVVAAIVGAACLMPALAAVQAKKRVLLANKEILVMAGEFFMHEVRKHQAELLPLDSEHNAIFQCLSLSDTTVSIIREQVAKITLTASGGAGRDISTQDLKHLTPEQACHHPTWRMGSKISVDSATLMNKGFEVIEACWLFGVNIDQIAVIIHPQSIVHALIEYHDGSVLAHLAYPDMRLPIAYGLAWPERLPGCIRRLSLLECHLDFKPVDNQHYPCLQLAYQAIKRGGTAPASLNAANEIAVQAFLDRKICFTEIALLNQTILELAPVWSSETLEMIWAADNIARKAAQQYLQHRMVSLKSSQEAVKHYFKSVSVSIK